MADGMHVEWIGQEHLQRNVREMMRLTKRERPIVMRNLARDFCWAAMKLTPQAPRGTRNRGFAKAAWKGCLSRLGVQLRSGFRSGGANTAVTLYNDVKKAEFGESGYIEVANQTPPIVALDQGGPNNPPHNIAHQAMMNTLAKMDKILAKLARRMERTWR